MKKAKRIKIILIYALALLFLAGCTSEDGAISSDQGDLFSSGQDAYEVSVEEKHLPEDYGEYTHFVDFDDDYYYFSTSDKDEPPRYIGVAQNGGNVLSFGGLSNDYIVKLQYGHEAKLYLGAITWNSVNDLVYVIYELTEGGGKQKKLFERKVSETPNVMPAEERLLMILNGEGKTELAVLNLNDGNLDSIASYENTVDNEGKVKGEVVTGVEWPYSVADSQGFVYCVTKLDNQRIDEKPVENNAVMYCDFETGDVKEVSSIDHQPSYIGGNPSEFITMDVPTGVARPEGRLYTKDDDNYGYMRLPKDEFGEELMGCGFLDEHRLIAYYPNGFYIVDTQDKTYAQGDFAEAARLSKRALAKMPIEDQSATKAFYKGRFIFSYTRAGRVLIAEVKIK